MFLLSSLPTTVYDLLHAASNVSYDVSKRPHFYIRPVAVLGQNIWGPGPHHLGGNKG